VHPVFYRTNVFEFVRRSVSATDFLVFHWDGSRLHSNGRRFEKSQEVANGDYVIEVRILKALGDPANPDHWESWTSPVITVARPTSHAGQGPIVPPGRH
jgi:minor extracellular serine protease Vpr